MFRNLISCAAALALVFSVAAVQAEDKDPLAGAKCPVSGKKINPEAFTAYKGGKVYFCCPGCPTGFAKNTAKFAAKANHQLAATGQAQQEKCPLTGRKINPKQSVSVAGVDVGLCCGGCKKKAGKASGDELVDLVFSDAAFKKGFTVGKDKKD